jgi:DsbC/DsbD-like thiol-disulfide interchange protein
MKRARCSRAHHKDMVRRMKWIALIVALTIPAAAEAAVGEWVTGQRAEVRLLASGVGPDGRLSAGVEVALPDGWTTYWRNPGDAGIPPVFDFRASKNVGATEIRYPVPTRQDDGADTVTNVYSGGVVFPLAVAIPDPAKPADLALTLHLGVCKEICVPEDVTVTLTVPSGENDAAAEKEIAAANARVPGPAQPGMFALDSVVQVGGTDRRPIFRFTGTVPDAENAVLFVEGPDDWAPYTPEFEPGDKPAWDVEFSRTGAKTPIAGATFRVTIQSGKDAIDQTLSLH